MNSLAAKPAGLRIHLLETGYQFLSLWRMPAFAIPTLSFPAMFYIFFGLVFSGGGGIHLPSYLLATYGTFGIMGPALFGFGVGVAGELGQGWLRLKRAAPMPPAAYLVSKLVMAMAFGLAVVLILFALGAAFGGVRFSHAQWLGLAGVLVAGTLPFCALGLYIGLRASTQAAPAIVNLIYLPLAFLSGLWVPLQFFPQWLQQLAVLLPPYHLARIALGITGHAPDARPWLHAAVLAGFTLLFTALAARAWRRIQE